MIYSIHNNKKGTARAGKGKEMKGFKITEITEKIVENKNNDIAKAFAMHIGNLLINNGIVPIMTENTRNDVKNIKDANEYKLVMEYGISFNELDCSRHDREVYNKAINDFQEWLKTQIVGLDNKTKEILVAIDDRWELATDKFKKI